MVQPADCGDLIRYIACLPKHVVMNEVHLAPTQNRGYVAEPATPALSLRNSVHGHEQAQSHAAAHDGAAGHRHRAGARGYRDGDLSGRDQPGGVAAAAGGCAGIALSGTPYRQTEMDASPAMQVVARIGVGYDAVEVPALTARRVPLMVAGTANSTRVAEQAFHLMIALAKKNRAMDALVRDGRWTDRHGGAADGAGRQDRADRRLRPHRHAARPGVASAFDMNVLIYDPYIDQAKITAAGCEPAADLDAALPRADFVSIHCPKNPATVGHVQRGAAGEDEAGRVHRQHRARRHHQRTGAVRGAGVRPYRRRRAGCVRQEPTPLDNKLLSLDNVISSPHMAGVTAEAVAGDGGGDGAEHPERAGRRAEPRQHDQPGSSSWNLSARTCRSPTTSPKLGVPDPADAGRRSAGSSGGNAWKSWASCPTCSAPTA